MITKNDNRILAIYRSALLAVFVLFLPSWSWGIVEDDYYGVYMPGGKVGFMHVHKDTKATYAKKPAVRTENETQITINALGNTAKTVSRTISFNDPKSGAPLALENRSEASGRVSTLSATYTGRTVTYTANIQGTKKTGTVALKTGESFLLDPSSGANDFIPQPGKAISGKTFVPETLRLMDEQVAVVRKEAVAVGNAKPVEAYVVEDRSEMGTVTLYVTPKGETILFRFALGMEARKEPKEIALRVPTAGEIAKRADLAITVGITPTGKPIDTPRQTTCIRYAVRGTTGQFPPSDNRQTADITGTGSNRIVALTVNAKPLPESAGITRFNRPEDAPAAVRSYLLPTDYVSSNDPEFTALAKEATEGETDIARAAAKIAAFVHQAIIPDSSIAVLRTASDIARDRRGVCREYTTFFTAIARNAGIPTRVCVGVVLADGAFVYHAWPEVWTGEQNGWVALEPTWGRPYADATHIKLAQGEITDLYRVADDMGRYRIEVVEVKAD